MEVPGQNYPNGGKLDISDTEILEKLIIKPAAPLKEISKLEIYQGLNERLEKMQRVKEAAVPLVVV